MKHDKFNMNKNYRYELWSEISTTITEMNYDYKYELWLQVMGWWDGVGIRACYTFSMWGKGLY